MHTKRGSVWQQQRANYKHVRTRAPPTCRQALAARHIEVREARARQQQPGQVLRIKARAARQVQRAQGLQGQRCTAGAGRQQWHMALLNWLPVRSTWRLRRWQLLAQQRLNEAAEVIAAQAQVCREGSGACSTREARQPRLVVRVRSKAARRLIELAGQAAVCVHLPGWEAATGRPSGLG